MLGALWEESGPASSSLSGFEGLAGAWLESLLGSERAMQRRRKFRVFRFLGFI